MFVTLFAEHIASLLMKDQVLLRKDAFSSMPGRRKKSPCALFRDRISLQDEDVKIPLEKKGLGVKQNLVGPHFPSYTHITPLKSNRIHHVTIAVTNIVQT